MTSLQNGHPAPPETAAAAAALSVTVPPSLAARVQALQRFEAQIPTIESWGVRLAEVLPAGGRLLVCGNGGSAAQAQHLAAEIVGRYHRERMALSAVVLSAEGALLTALVNDYPAEEIFARQVLAHGRPGDVFLGMSTSGRSANVRRAAEVARDGGLLTWGLTGPGITPIGSAVDELVAVDAPSTAIVQEVHLAAVHLLCAAMDDVLLGPGDAP